MKLWSRGLGSTEVIMDFERYVVDKEGKNVYIYGNMIEPVQWDFKITMEPSDMVGFMKMFFSWSMIIYALTNCWKFIPYIFSKKVKVNKVEKIESINKAYEMLMRGQKNRSKIC